MAFSPTNRVYLLDTPLDNTYKNQLYFNSRSDQYNYFRSKVITTVDDVDYIRHDNKIIIDGQMDDYWQINYVMYQNTDFNNRWFYAFVTKMEWESERSFAIYIETDVYQTWMLDCKLLESFVIREHVKDDRIGANLVDEGLELGEYTINDSLPTLELDEIWFIMAVSDTKVANGTVIRNIYGNVYSGLAYFAYSPADYQKLSNDINDYTSNERGDAIQFIYTIPKAMLPKNIVSGDIIPKFTDYGHTTTKYPTFADSPLLKEKFKKLNGYEPINKKLYCYPYNFLYVTNNNGGYCEYRFENFNNFENSKELEFELTGSIHPNPVVMLHPRYYKNTINTYEVGLQLSGYPFCSWASDTFKAWIAQNGVTTGIGVLSSLGAVVAGAVTTNPIMMAGGAMAVTSQLAQLYKASIQPDQARGNTNNGSLNVGIRNQVFTFFRYSLKADYAERIDKFFSMYGYKVNKIKVPEVKSRISWNYVQTIDVNITGGIPADDMKRLKQVYNEGVTLWHDARKLGNYGYVNSIR